MCNTVQQEGMVGVGDRQLEHGKFYRATVRNKEVVGFATKDGMFWYTRPEFDSMGGVGQRSVSNAREVVVTDPPRMAEPGWGERVIAGSGFTERQVWLRFHTADGAYCYRNQVGNVAKWSELIDPEPYNESENK